RLGDATLTILDVRTPEEYTGRRGNQCDPRQGHIPGARNLEVGQLFEGPGRPAPPERIRELVGQPEGTQIVAYCHSGSRSALATLALRCACEPLDPDALAEERASEERCEHDARLAHCSDLRSRGELKRGEHERVGAE